MKYCWQHVEEYLEYRSSIGLSVKNARAYINDFSKYLKTAYPNETLFTKDITMSWCI